MSGMEYILRLELKMNHDEPPMKIAGREVVRNRLGHHSFTAASDEEARKIARRLIRKAVRADLYRWAEDMLNERGEE